RIVPPRRSPQLIADAGVAGHYRSIQGGVEQGPQSVVNIHAQQGAPRRRAACLRIRRYGRDMGVTYSSVVDAPRDEVFAWHTRPGAINRLSPPWSPLRVITESDSLKDGRATLALPGGLRWVAEHQPDSYNPPTRFVDTIGSDGLASWPARFAVRWRHTHEFEDLEGIGGRRRTRVVDRVDTPVPGSALRPMFAYRHRQLADDLAAHHLAAEHGLAPVTVAITGSSGLVG